jgi:Flp pilus assembly protein TadB
MPHVYMSAWQSSLLVVSVALAGGWLLMLWLVSMSGRQRRVRAQPETGDLGPEPCR